MRLRLLLIPAAIAAVAVLFGFWGGGGADTIARFVGQPPPQPPTATRTKPICSQAIVPTGADCIPQHMANLPPDPGEAGKATIEGIDADKDGVRDDVQRYIVENWSHSERAMQALFLVAKGRQQHVSLGDSLGKEETRKLWPEIERISDCSTSIETPDMLRLSAIEQVRVRVLNTPERYLRAKEFDLQFAQGAFLLGAPKTPVEACGFDPSALPN